MNRDRKTGLLSIHFSMLCVLSIGIVCGSVSPGYAQSYYPDEFGNTWHLRSIDAIDERIITIKGPEIIDGKELKIIEDQTNDDISQFFVKIEPDGIKLFRSVSPLALVGQIIFDYSPPQVFLPIPIDLGWQWTVRGEATLPLLGKIISTIRSEVVSIEDVTVPAGTFRNCLKTEQNITHSLIIGVLELKTTMWLAPNVGFVKAINSKSIIFELIDYDVAIEDIEIEDTEIAVQPKGRLATKWASLKKKEMKK